MEKFKKNNQNNSKHLDLRKKSSYSTINNHPQYHPKKKSRAIISTILIILSGVLIGIGIYIIFLLLTPKLHKKPASEVKKEATQISENNMLYIPSAGVNAEIAEGDVNVLDKGKIWHRLPYEGNPTTGGNTILTGHSFIWGYSPEQIKKKSIFYNLSDAKIGDEVIIKWNRKNYNYKIIDKKTVKPNDVSIESPSKEDILTIYTCTMGGSSDGRVVLIAKPN